MLPLPLSEAFAPMLFVPLPFVVALVLAILLVRMQRDGEGWPANRLFFALVLVYGLQSILIGLRWGYDTREVLPAQAVIAAVIAALAFVAFSGLEGERPAEMSVRALWHAAPAVLVALLVVFWRDLVGVALILIFLGYGAALVRLALKGTDGLAAARLDGALRSYRALQLTAAALIASALADILISADYALTGGTHSGAVVAIGNVLALLMLGAAASSVQASRVSEPLPSEPPQSEPQPPAPSAATVEDLALAERLEALMRSKGLYRDLELSLDRIARRLSQPARRVSEAVNRVHGTSVSQYVNGLRVEDACRLLVETGDPVTKIMFDAGFLSKSNFNREFLRVTGTSPSAWRQSRRQADENTGRLRLVTEATTSRDA